MNEIIASLEQIIEDRKQHSRPNSYTCQLLDAGQTGILKKVGEEAVKVVVAGALENDERLISEIADLFFHLTVALAARDPSWIDVEEELKRRNS